MRGDLGRAALQLVDARHQETSRDLAVLLNVVDTEGSRCGEAEELGLATRWAGERVNRGNAGLD